MCRLCEETQGIELCEGITVYSQQSDGIGNYRSAKCQSTVVVSVTFYREMAHQQMPIWATDADIDEDVDLSLAIGNYGQGHFEDGASL